MYTYRCTCIRISMFLLQFQCSFVWNWSTTTEYMHSKQYIFRLWVLLRPPAPWLASSGEPPQNPRNVPGSRLRLRTGKQRRSQHSNGLHLNDKIKTSKLTHDMALTRLTVSTSGMFRWLRKVAMTTGSLAFFSWWNSALVLLTRSTSVKDSSRQHWTFSRLMEFDGSQLFRCPCFWWRMQHDVIY